MPSFPEVDIRGIRILRRDVERILTSRDPIRPTRIRNFWLSRTDAEPIGAKAIVYQLTKGATHHGNEAAEALMKLGFTVRARRRYPTHAKKPWTDYIENGFLVFDDGSLAARNSRFAKESDLEGV